jgi:hypothetical protein
MRAGRGGQGGEAVVSWRDELPGQLMPGHLSRHVWQADLATALEHRGWQVATKLRTACETEWEGFDGVPSVLLARELEFWRGEKCCERPDGAR